MNPAAHRQLARRAAEAYDHLRVCRLCPRACGVNRLQGQKGYCGLDDRLRCFREMLHHHEESPLNPSHQLYFAGCALRCEFCSVWEWNLQPDAAPPANMDHLAAAMAQRRAQGARNVNLLGGEPAMSIAGVLDLLARLPADTPVVWNTCLYYGRAVHDWLADLVDTYLVDVKCGNGACAAALLDAADYLDVVMGNLQTLVVKQEHIIVRHVVLPGHFECCTLPVLRLLAEHAPAATVSLRGDYVPPPAPVRAPAAYLEPDQLNRAADYAHALGLEMVT